MSANLFQKGVALALIGSSVLFVGAMYMKGPKVDKRDAFKVRQELLKRQDTKMLYSTMSFFYLQGYKQQSIDSLLNLHEIMSLQQPNLVALPISRQQYDKKYTKMMKHPKYRESMDKLIFDLKNKSEESIRDNKDFNLKNLEKLYLIDMCQKNKKCKIVCGRRTNEEYENMEGIYKSIQNNEQVESLGVDQMKVDDYTQSILQQMKPTLKFNILPQSPYKTVVGIIQPELLKATAEKWKKKFQKNYSHVVIEDQQVMQRQKKMREAQNKPI